MEVLSFAGLYPFLSAEKPIKVSSISYDSSRNFCCCCSAVLKPGELSLTHQVFDEIPLKDTFAWNNLIQTHLTNGDSCHVLPTYRQMLLRGVRPDRHTLPRVITASRFSGDLLLGKQVHAQALKFGFACDQYVITALIEMYGRLESVDAAKWLHDKSSKKNSVSWTLLARLYVKKNKSNLAIGVLHQMVESGAEIDSVALVTALGACGLIKSLEEGRKVHRIATECGLAFDVLVSNSLMKMYIDCGSIEDARAVFDQMSTRDIISWTAMTNAYVKKGGYNEGLKLFRQMIMNGEKPDPQSVASVLPACARMVAHKQGKEIHGYLLRNGVDLNIQVCNAIIDMYVKSGYIESAIKMFKELKVRDVISWTVMIMGYSLHGQGRLGVQLFQEMEKDPSIVIDQTTYSTVLHACSTACMVQEGKFYFNCIKAPQAAHYALMVALLARAGCFDEAAMFIEEQKIGRFVEVLWSLLVGYRIHKETELGKWVIEQLWELEPLNADNYVLLSNWYAENGEWEKVKELEEMANDMGLKPTKAYSWLEYKNKIHVFGTGDVSHPRSEIIRSELHCLMKKMEAEGHRPGKHYILHDVDKERECTSAEHSEMLAIAFGVITTQAGTPIRVTKNLRMCHICHDSAKVISKLVGREIIVKDLNGFHHFQNGYCSCGNCW